MLSLVISSPFLLTPTRLTPHFTCLSPFHSSMASDMDALKANSIRKEVEAISKLREVDGSRNVALVSKGESTLSRIWDLRVWDRHTQVKRYWRHIYKWPRSTTAKLILPVCFVFAAWATAFHWIRPRFFPNFTLPLAPLSLVSSAIALLLTLRTNQSLGRLQEARVAWGRLVLHSRECSGLLARYMRKDEAVLCCKHLSLLGWCLKARLRDESDDDVIDVMLPEAEASYIKRQRKRFIGLLRRVHQIVQKEAASGRLMPQAHKCINEQLFSLNQCIGISERLIGSPVPPTYTRHTSRVLLSWMALVPVALETMNLSLPLVLASTVVTAYVMIGIDEIGVELEQPFQLLPLNGLSRALMLDVSDEIEGDECL